jgi:hypothetical protein
MCEEPILAQFGAPSRHLSVLRQATLAEVNITDPLCPDVISRSTAYKEKILPIRKQPYCVNCIAVPYTPLSAEDKRFYVI